MALWRRTAPEGSGRRHDRSLKPYLRVFRGISKTTLPGYIGFFQFLRNFRQQNACEQAELILQAALDPTIARKAKKGELVTRFDHFDLLTNGDKLSDIEWYLRVSRPCSALYRNAPVGAAVFSITTDMALLSRSPAHR